MCIVFADFLVDSTDKPDYDFMLELLIPYLMVNSLANFFLITPYLGYTVVKLFSPPPISSKVSILLNIRRMRIFFLNLVFGVTLGVQIFAGLLFFTQNGGDYVIYKDNLVFFADNDIIFEVFWIFNVSIQIYQIYEIWNEV